MALTFIPDVPGRGAWTRKGGLLPIRPTSTNPYGFYRAALAGETPVGAAWVRGTDKSDSAHSVWAAVCELQKRLGFTGADVDGWLGAKTGEAILARQKALGLTADGIAGPGTMEALLRPEIEAVARRYAIPAYALGGISFHESGADLAAVGVNGVDHGGMQINLQAHEATVTWAQAMDYAFALDWSARDLKRVIDRWTGKTKADPVDIAIANHNSPRAAQQWAIAGQPVPDPSRSFPIEQYVDDVHDAW